MASKYDGVRQKVSRLIEQDKEAEREKQLESSKYADVRAAVKAARTNNTEVDLEKYRQDQEAAAKTASPVGETRRNNSGGNLYTAVPAAKSPSPVEPNQKITVSPSRGETRRETASGLYTATPAKRIVYADASQLGGTLKETPAKTVQTPAAEPTQKNSFLDNLVTRAKYIGERLALNPAWMR